MPVYSQEILYDERMRPLEEERVLRGKKRELSYVYDAQNQLTEVRERGGEGSVRYQYDERGNRIVEYRGGSLYCSYLYDAANRVVGAEYCGAEGTVRYEHDACGNPLSRGERSYSYDVAGRLRGVSGSAGEVEYKYSGLDLRVGGVGGVSSEYLFYDGSQEALVEVGESSRESYWLGLDRLLAGSVGGRGVERAYRDVGQSVVGFSGESELCDYDAYGGGEARYSYGFSGKPYLSDACLYESRGRKYDACIGRFDRPDPLGLVDGPNVYRYGRNNPRLYWDPWGYDARSGRGGLFGSLASSAAAGKSAYYYHEAVNTVYIGFNEEGNAAYVGITNDIDRRDSEHDYIIFPVANDLHRYQARALEQHIMNMNTHFQNKRASISNQRTINNVLFQPVALEWAMSYLSSNPNVTEELNSFGVSWAMDDLAVSC